MGEHRWDSRVGTRRRKDAYALSVRLSSIRLSSVRFSPYASRASVPFQRPPFPDVDVAHGENQDEHQHLHEQEPRSEEHTSELQSRLHLVCRLLLEKKKSPRSRCSG